MNTTHTTQINNALTEIQAELSTLTMPYNSALTINRNLEVLRLSLSSTSIETALEVVKIDEPINEVEDENQFENELQLAKDADIILRSKDETLKSRYYQYTKDFVNFYNEETIKRIEDTSEYFEGFHDANYDLLDGKRIYYRKPMFGYTFNVFYLEKVRGKDEYTEVYETFNTKESYEKWSRKLKALKKADKLLPPPIWKNRVKTAEEIELVDSFVDFLHNYEVSSTHSISYENIDFEFILNEKLRVLISLDNNKYRFDRLGITSVNSDYIFETMSKPITIENLFESDYLKEYMDINHKSRQTVVDSEKYTESELQKLKWFFREYLYNYEPYYIQNRITCRYKEYYNDYVDTKELEPA